MKSPVSRRTWRILYRRSRVYVPLVVLLLLAMALFLPLSPDWLAREVEKRLQEATGLEVEVDQVRLQLIAAEVDLSGLRLISPEADAPPFEIGSVQLDGTLPELLAGDGGWPATVVVANPSVLRVARMPDGVEPRGALRTVLEAIEEVREQPADDGGGPLEGRTPRVTVRNVRFALERPDANDVSLFIQNIEMGERAGAGEPLAAQLRGVIDAGSSETLTGSITYLPEQQRGRARFSTDAVSRTFSLPVAGEMTARARSMNAFVSLSRTDAGEWQGNFDAELLDFILREERVGGERWTEPELAVSGGATYVPGEKRLRDATARIFSPTVDLEAGGSLSLTGDLPADVSVEAAQLPPLVPLMLRREARLAGVVVDSVTSPTLRLKATATGPLRRPGELAVNGSFAVAGWEVSGRGWAEPLIISRVEANLEDNTLSVPVARGSWFGLIADATASLEFPAAASEGLVSVSVNLDGNPVDIVPLARSAGLLPGLINGLDVPISLNLSAAVPVALSQDGGNQVVFQPFSEDSSLNGRLAWQSGELQLADFAQPVRFSAGQAAFSPQRIRLESLQASLGDLSGKVEGTLSAPEGLWTRLPDYDVQVTAESEIPEIAELVETLARLPASPDLVSGNVLVQGEARGRWGNWSEIDYTADLVVRNAAATLTIPDSTVSFSELYAEANITPRKVELARLKARVQNAADVSLGMTATEEKLTSEVSISSPLSVVQQILPHDTRELVMEGDARAAATVALIPRAGLPAGPDIPRRWFAAFTGADTLRVGVKDDAEMRLDIDAQLFPGEDVSFFHRDFPHPITDVRGSVTADETGFQFHDVLSTWGQNEDVLINGYVTLGHLGPVKIVYTLDVPGAIDLNEWTTGWGKREWRERPFVRPDSRDRRDPDVPRLITDIEGRISVGKARLLWVNASSLDADLKFQSWRGKRNNLEVTLYSADMYDGTMTGTMDVLLKSGEDAAEFDVSLQSENVQMQTFLEDLLEREQTVTGLVSATANWNGQFGDFSTWQGTAAYDVIESRFIGRQVFRRLSRLIELGEEERQSPTTIRGTAVMNDEVIVFPDLIVESDRIQMLAPGEVHFDGSIEFLLTVNLFARTLGEVPVVGALINDLRNTLLSFRVGGTIADPLIQPEPIVIGRDEFQTKAGEALDAVRGALTRTERLLPQRRQPQVPGETEEDLDDVTP